MSPDTAPPPPQEVEPPSRVEPDPPSARTERSRWPGWIWGIPVAAVAIVAWLAFKELAATGPKVTVIFPEAEGISAGQTEVLYQGLKVGEVESVRLEKDLRHVRAEIRLKPEMDSHIGPGTLFWINGPTLSNLSSIRAIIAGPSIGIEPQPGGKQDEYQGLAKPPVVSEPVPGHRYVLRASDPGSVSRGSAIFFRSLDVGTVESVTLASDRTFAISAFVRSPYDALVHEGTRFWNAGAVQVSLDSAGPRLQLQSLPALLGGAVAFETPSGVAEGPVAPGGTTFTLYESKTAAEFAPEAHSVAYQVVFGPEAGALQKGAAVNLAGHRVGSVIESRLVYDQSGGALREQVTLGIEPWRIALSGGATWSGTGRGEMDALMRRLIREGLRAQPGSSIPLVGPSDVELTFVNGVKPATLIAGNPPEIPTAPGGAGLNGLMTAVSGIAGKLDRLPIDQIAGNIRTITDRLATLSESPGLTRSLGNLEQTLANLEQVSASAKTELPALIASLRKLASQADRTVADARQLISTTAGTGPMGTNTAGLSQTLYELSRAAE
ncbi:MAG TPA: MlaD family protein, partial [Acetobacteraceae bacterium]|nr:MlaD family protein [Acetobacteraceae bacterium]